MNRLIPFILLFCVGCTITNDGIVIHDFWSPQPNPVVVDPVTPVPEPVEPRPVSHEFRCLIIEDVTQRASLPRTQLAMLTGKNVRDFLKANCAKDDSGNPQYRFIDKSTVPDLTGVWAAIAKKSTSDRYPKLILQNGNDYLDKPLPTDWAELQSYLEKYAGVSP